MMLPGTPRFSTQVQLDAITAAEKRWRAEPDLFHRAIRERFGLSESATSALAKRLRAEGVLEPIVRQKRKYTMTRLM